jgi:hypothetical protein
MTPLAKNLLDRVASWPDEDVLELDELAREIEARRTGVYVIDDAEWAALRSRCSKPTARNLFLTKSSSKQTSAMGYEGSLYEARLRRSRKRFSIISTKETNRPRGPWSALSIGGSANSATIPIRDDGPIDPASTRFGSHHIGIAFSIALMATR